MRSIRGSGQQLVAVRERSALSAAVVFAGAGLLASCATERAVTQYRVTFEVYSDLNVLPGAQLMVRGRPAAVTDAAGTARLAMQGQDGVMVPVTVRCPAGTRSPQQPVEVTLRTLQVFDRAAAARGIVHRVNCPPDDRTLAVIVRTNGRAGLPLMWQGREVSRTDENGMAHVVFHAHPTQQIQLALATDASPLLRPTSPTHQFMVPDADDVQMWPVDFQDAAPAAAPRVHHGGGGGHGPRRGGGHRIIQIRGGNR